MAALAKLLTSPARIGLVAMGVALLLTGWLAHDRGLRLRALEAERAGLELRLETAGEQLREQNRAVEALAAAGDRVRAEAQVAAQKAAKALGRSEARVKALEAAQVPKACSDALEWLRQQAAAVATRGDE